MGSGKFDQRISFDSSDSRATADWQRRNGNSPGLMLTGTEKRLSAALQGEEDEEGTRACSNGTWCHAATRDDTGIWHPARSYQPYCPSCRSVIAGRLAELPEACVRLLMAIGERPKTGKAVRVPPGPREPVRLEVDALVKLMGWVLGSWHERIARVYSLTPPDLDAGTVHHPERAVAAAVRVICPPGQDDRVDALLAFEREPMTRVMFDPVAAEEWLALTDPEEEGIVRLSGEADMSPRLSGVHAGREILELHQRARRILGQVKPPPETFPGVPCRSCTAMNSLERAEPPSDPKVPAKKSRCTDCGDLMDDVEYDDWVKWYRGYAERLPGLSCRRCQAGRCGECGWDRCDCAARNHVTSGNRAA